MSGAEFAIYALPALVSAACGGAALMIRARVQRLHLREDARRDHVRNLPPNSLVIDLGKNGMVIEVGSRDPDGRERHDDDR